MNEQDKRRYEQPVPASLYFDESLRIAIEAGNASAIRASLKRQETNNVTEGIGNYLLLRSLFVGQKGELVRLEGSYCKAKSMMDLYDSISDCFDRLDAQFEDIFTDGEQRHQYPKLSGDALFREALSKQTEDLPLLARQIAAIDLKDLLPPEEAYDLAEKVTEEIFEALNSMMALVQRNEINSEVRSNLRRRVAGQIKEIDNLLLNKQPSDGAPR